SASPLRKEAAARPNASGDPLCKYPITCMAPCCARAASGHAAAQASSVMNARRLTSGIGFPPTRRVVRGGKLAAAALPHAQLAADRSKVLGPHLNRQESSRAGDPFAVLPARTTA